MLHVCCAAANKEKSSLPPPDTGALVKKRLRGPERRRRRREGRGLVGWLVHSRPQSARPTDTAARPSRDRFFYPPPPLSSLYTARHPQAVISSTPRGAFLERGEKIFPSCVLESYLLIARPPLWKGYLLTSQNPLGRVIRAPHTKISYEDEKMRNSKKSCISFSISRQSYTPRKDVGRVKGGEQEEARQTSSHGAIQANNATYSVSPSSSQIQGETESFSGCSVFWLDGQTVGHPPTPSPPAVKRSGLSIKFDYTEEKGRLRRDLCPCKHYKPSGAPPLHPAATRWLLHQGYKNHQPRVCAKGYFIFLLNES